MERDGHKCFWGCLAWNKQKITQKRVTFGCQIRATTWLIMHDGGRMAVSHDLRVSPSTFDCSASSHLFQRPDEADRETYMESNCRMWRRRLRRKSLERKWWKIDFLVCFYFLFFCHQGNLSLQSHPLICIRLVLWFNVLLRTIICRYRLGLRLNPRWTVVFPLLCSSRYNLIQFE